MRLERDTEPLPKISIREDLDGREPSVALDYDEPTVLLGREKLLMLPETVRQNGVDQLVDRLVAPEPEQDIILLFDRESFVRKPRVRGIEVQVGWGMMTNDLQGESSFLESSREPGWYREADAGLRSTALQFAWSEDSWLPQPWI